MQTLGLIGGLTCESSTEYYRMLNALVRERLGPEHTSRLLLWSFSLSDVLPLFLHDKPAYIDALVAAGLRLESAGVDALMICSNSAHMAAAELAERAEIPVIGIIDSIADELRGRSLSRPLVLGTDFVMEGDFYIPTLEALSGVDAMVPDSGARHQLNQILLDELAQGIVTAESRDVYLQVIDAGMRAGADSVVLGCTEHNLLLNDSMHPLPLLDSTALHVAAAVDFQLGDAEAAPSIGGG